MPDEKLKQEIKELQAKVDKYEKETQISRERKKKGFKFITGIFLGNNLRDAVEKFIEKAPNKLDKKSIADLTYGILNGLLKFSFIRFLLAIVPMILVTIQLYVLMQQNSILEQQTKGLQNQLTSIEAERKSSYIFLVNNIMDKMDSEIKDGENRKLGRKLSIQTISRIAALSQTLKPYNYKDDEGREKELSPERGYLSNTIGLSELDTSIYKILYDKVTFKKSDLEQAKLNQSYLKGAYLRGSDLSDGFILNSNLENAFLIECDLRNTQFSNSNFEGAKLWHSKVHSSKWFDLLEQENVKGISYLRENFVVSDSKLEDEEGLYYLVECVKK